MTKSKVDIYFDDNKSKYDSNSFLDEPYAEKMEKANANILYDTIRNNNLTGIDIEQLLTQAIAAGYIKAEDYQGTDRAIFGTDSNGRKLAQRIADQIKKTYRIETDGSGWQQFWQNVFHRSSTDKSMAYTFDRLNEYIKDAYTGLDYNNLVNAFGSIPSGSDIVPGVSAPNYFNTDVDTTLRDVDPVKWWTSQELADLHGIDFNPDDYYELLKKGTSAEVLRALNEAGRIGNDARRQDTRQLASYLDSLRKEKSEAINTGLTAGARAANEILGNTENLTNYADTLLNTASKQVNATNNAFLQDANARITARDYWDTLAKSLANTGTTLYDNDSQRYAQDWLTNAELYRANQLYRGNAINENANMYAAYAQGQANVNAARAAVDGANNEFKQVWDVFYNDYLNQFKGQANQQQLSMNRATSDFKDYFWHQYTNSPNYKNFLANVK